MVTLLQNGRILTGGACLDGYDILIEGQTIISVCPHGMLSAGQTVDLQGVYIAPGFIDLHCHGGNGYEFIDGTRESIVNAAAVHAAGGTRVLYPTLSAASFSDMWRALEAIEAARTDCPLEIAGVHLEGPYLSVQMSGAQDTSCITPPIEEEYMALIRRFGSLIARWTYAPEHDDGRFLAALTSHGIVPSVGHSAAEYAHVEPAFRGGCRLVTHFYSCTSTITRHSGFRHLGIIESAYLLDGMDVEAIGDGCHLPPELLRLIVKLKGPEHVCLITDAIRYAGMQSCDALSGGTENVPYLIEDGVAKLADRSAFAGSIATTGVLLRQGCACGFPLPTVVQMMTQTPARVMGLHRKGQIAPGYDAQFTCFDDQLNILPGVPAV